jgi:hypothetical protein
MNTPDGCSRLPSVSTRGRRKDKYEREEGWKEREEGWKDKGPLMFVFRAGGGIGGLPSVRGARRKGGGRGREDGWRMVGG